MSRRPESSAKRSRGRCSVQRIQVLHRAQRPELAARPGNPGDCRRAARIGHHVAGPMLTLPIAGRVSTSGPYQAPLATACVRSGLLPEKAVGSDASGGFMAASLLMICRP